MLFCWAMVSAVCQTACTSSSLYISNFLVKRHYPPQATMRLSAVHSLPLRQLPHPWKAVSPYRAKIEGTNYEFALNPHDSRPPRISSPPNRYASWDEGVQGRGQAANSQRTVAQQHHAQIPMPQPPGYHGWPQEIQQPIHAHSTVAQTIAPP